MIITLHALYDKLKGRQHFEASSLNNFPRQWLMNKVDSVDCFWIGVVVCLQYSLYTHIFIRFLYFNLGFLNIPHVIFCTLFNRTSEVEHVVRYCPSLFKRQLWSVHRLQIVTHPRDLDSLNTSTDLWTIGLHITIDVMFPVSMSRFIQSSYHLCTFFLPVHLFLILTLSFCIISSTWQQLSATHPD